MAELTAVNKLPICTDCEHVATSTGSWENFKCRAPDNEIDRQLNLINGELTVRRKVELCKDARKEPQFCGESGVWFKERVYTVIDKNAPIIKAREKSGKITADDL